VGCPLGAGGDTFPTCAARDLAGGWRSLKPILLVAGVVTPALYGLLAIALFTGVWQGLAERGLVGVCQLWICLLAGNLIRVSLALRPAAPDPGAPGPA